MNNGESPVSEGYKAWKDAANDVKRISVELCEAMASHMLAQESARILAQRAAQQEVDRRLLAGLGAPSPVHANIPRELIHREMMDALQASLGMEEEVAELRREYKKARRKMDKLFPYAVGNTDE